MILQLQSKVHLVVALLVLVLSPSCTSRLSRAIARGNDDSWTTKNHAPGFCAMRSICGARKDKDPLNCPDNQEATQPDTDLATALKATCPTFWASSGKEDGKYCCTADQVVRISTSTAKALPFISSCPACKHNFVHFWCVLSCSGDQATFTNVTAVQAAYSTNSTAVAEVDLWLSDKFASALYDSCKDVKFGPFHTSAMRVIGGGAKTPQEWLDFLGLLKDKRTPAYGSPFQQNFRPAGEVPSAMKALDDGGLVGCGDAGDMTCGCRDCPSAPGCDEELLLSLGVEVE